MKRTLIISLIDGTKHEHDLAPIAKHLPINAPATHQDYKNICIQTGMSGFFRTENETSLDYVPPALITGIQIKFEN